jgi:hypothetical protein
VHGAGRKRSRKSAKQTADETEKQGWGEAVNKRDKAYFGWPRDSFGEPILTSTQDALEFGSLIIGDRVRKKVLEVAREICIQKIKTLMRETPRQYQYELDLACKAQFFREALEEAERIRNCTSRNSKDHANSDKELDSGSEAGMTEGNKRAGVLEWTAQD